MTATLLHFKYRSPEGSLGTAEDLFSGPLCLGKERQLGQLRDGLKAVPVCACYPQPMGVTPSIRAVLFQVGHCPPDMVVCCSLCPLPLPSVQTVGTVHSPFPCPISGSGALQMFSLQGAEALKLLKTCPRKSQGESWALDWVMFQVVEVETGGDPGPCCTC